MNDSTQDHELIYDWNVAGSPPSYEPTIEFDDETLRDGLQSPSVTQPPIEDKIKLLHMMVDLGIQGADIGLPGAGKRATEDVIALSKEIANQKLPIAPNCAARTLATDIDPIIEASQQSGISLEASVFIGSSPIREYVENWTLDFMRECTEKSVTYAIKNGLTVMFVTEDTTRARPEVLRTLYSTAIECGARRICLSDTVGHANPHGTRMLVKFMKEVVEQSGEDVMIDWHGHRDRALSVENAIAAAEAGANRLHGTALGVGERCGNVPMEHMLVNFRLLGVIDNDLSRLPEYCRLVSESCNVPIPCGHPVMGADAYRTSTGVHAAAVIKAIKKNDTWLVNRVYSGVPADWTGRAQAIEIGPMSGASNVIYWLQSRGIEPTESLVARIFDTAKEHNRVMTEEEVYHIVSTLVG
jgi:2-isopropylmalate synthase